jgi:CRISPR/Cas system CMR-associated protein Cmr5 small subunit
MDADGKIDVKFNSYWYKNPGILSCNIARNKLAHIKHKKVYN